MRLSGFLNLVFYLLISSLLSTVQARDVRDLPQDLVKAAEIACSQNSSGACALVDSINEQAPADTKWLQPHILDDIDHKAVIKAICNGGMLLAYIVNNANTEGVAEPGSPMAESPYQDPSALTSKYAFSIFSQASDAEYGDPQDLATALQGLGVPFDTSWSSWEARWDGLEVRRALAYLQWMSPQHGVITVMGIFAPRLEDPSTQTLPEIPNRWSDVAFLGWKELCDAANVSPTTLRYVLQANILNEATVSVIDTILGGAYLPAPLWPGLRFTADSWEGLALLGSPNVYGTAWMLIQHYSTLGPKIITAVILYGEPESGPHLVIEIGPYAPPFQDQVALA